MHARHQQQRGQQKNQKQLKADGFSHSCARGFIKTLLPGNVQKT
jgi:hypothetical protein